MKRALISLAAVLGLMLAAFAFLLFGLPRPPDTTDPRIFQGDASRVDHCDLPELDGSGRTADEVPKAFTPGCGWEEFPLPILADCTEPLAEDAVDMRGLWLAYTGAKGHVERIEQCGNRVVVTSSGIIHDFRTDGTLRNGSRDTEPPWCVNTFVSIDYAGDVMTFHPFGLPVTIVERWMEDGELVWTYPAIEEEVRMRRICKLPEAARSGGRVP